MGLNSCNSSTRRSRVLESLKFGGFWLGGFEHRDFNHQVFAPRQELVQRRVESANGDREAIHGAKYSDEIGALQRQ